ncbi:MAG: hypothetical protein IT203_12635, partial [Fimbriimonadaceae bacterium]|nr:hypothetical protein [Fimbriimonadaceae bacterium]
MKRFSAVSLFIVAAVISFGQFSARGRSAANMSLLETGSGFLIFPSVQKELGMDPKVAKKISLDYQQGIQKMVAGMSAGRDKDPKARQAESMKLMEDVRKIQVQALGKLNAKQQERLKQIAVQQMCAGGLLHPEVKKSLNLTADQERKIGAIVRDGSMQMMSGAQPPKQGATPQDLQQRMQELNKKRAEWQVKMNLLSI